MNWKKYILITNHVKNLSIKIKIKQLFFNGDKWLVITAIQWMTLLFEIANGPHNELKKKVW